MMWDSETFYSKSQLYVQQAEKLAPEDRFFVFWHLLSYELLIRAAVSYKSKALLADPKYYQNMLFAVGVEVTKTPSQRSIGELLEISKALLPNFTEEDFKKSLSWIGFRNEEVHTGSDRLEEVAQTGWLGDYYRITKNILDYLGKDLENYFGSEKVEMIKKMIVEQKKELISEVKKEIGSAKSYYSRLTTLEKDNVRKLFKRPPKTKVCKCPSCDENLAVIGGDLVSVSEPELDGGELFSIAKYLPTNLACSMCRLSLEGYSSISIAERGATFSIKEYIDPVEQFNIDIRGEFIEKYPEYYLERDEYMDE